MERVRQNDYIKNIATLKDLVTLGYFKTVEEADAYFTAQEEAQPQAEIEI